MDDDVQDAHWLQKFVMKFQEIYEDVQREKHGEPKSEREEEIDRIAAVIKSLRGIEDEVQEEDEKPWVDRARFELMFCGVTVLQAISIGLETDLDPRPADRGWLWIILEFLFLCAFWTEIALKFRVHGKYWPLYSTMNMVLIVLTVVGSFDWLCLGIPRKVGALEQKGFLRNLALLRLMTLIRLSRFLRQHRSLEELRLAMVGLGHSLQIIVWVSILTIGFLYISAIVTTKTIGHNPEVYTSYRLVSGGWDHEKMFGTIGRSINTLLKVMTGDGWSSIIVRHVGAQQWYMRLFFIVFILVSTHGLLNVVVSVIVEHTVTAASTARSKAALKEDKIRKAEVECIREIFEIADTDGSDTLDLGEFMEAIRQPDIQRRFRQIDLPLGEAAKLFGVLEGAGTRELTIKEFTTGCSMHRGFAQSKDLLSVQAAAVSLARKMDSLQDNLSETERLMFQLDEVTGRIARRFTMAVRGTRQRLAHQRGGLEPAVPVKRSRPGMQENLDLSVGNRPSVPSFPNLLR
eukprot:TRINITY_DN10477_c0_g1_i1.p1 TRINITY_DN10477_c0_g1~~TRINITY_DN10477_c0_g1_i1.p1  ORF type:complete len:517 (+),score=134.47 TRINITY_DN10477_c0_g1_i1:112-1662(+)